MNAAKAREYFSAYLEGDLNVGLKQAFEKALSEDSSLKREYDHFCSILLSFENEKSAEIDIPSTLHEQIMAKLDNHEWVEKQNSKGSLFGRYRTVMIGGLASLAVISGILAVTLPNPSGDVSTAGVVPTVRATSSAEITVTDGQLNLNVKSDGVKEVTIRNARSGEEIDRWELRNSRASSPLTNLNANAASLAVFIGTDKQLIVVLPGTAAKKATSATGSIIDCAEIMADSFRNPIILRVADVSRTITWDLSDSSDLGARAKQMANNELSLSVLDNGLLLLTDAK